MSKSLQMKRELNIGWTATILSTIVASWWAFWGANENFHEGWWVPELHIRLLGTLAYLAPMLISMGLAVISIWRPKVGAVLMFLFGLFFTGFIIYQRWGAIDLRIILGWAPVTIMVIGLGALWWFGVPRPVKLAYAIAIGLPLLIAIGFSVEPAIRVSQRVDDGITSERLVSGNGVELIWAPEGPGWVRDQQDSVDWDEAMDLASRLSEDGTQLMDEPLNFWRLPTIDEAVRSLTRGGENAGGEWDTEQERATYRIQPDQESPLWRVWAETIYWWTSTEAGPDRAYRIVCNGQVHALRRDLNMGTLGFRAVREPGITDTDDPS